jgi:hypothetical protein
VYEIEACPRIPDEEIGWQHVTLEPITTGAGRDKITGSVDAALREWEDVVDGGDLKLERSGAVDTAPAAVTHHSVFNRTLLVAEVDAL